MQIAKTLVFAVLSLVCGAIAFVLFFVHIVQSSRTEAKVVVPLFILLSILLIINFVKHKK